MIFLPRIARSLHHPALAVVLGLLLVGVAVFGLVSGDIPKVWAILILVVGALNVLRAVPHPDASRPDPSGGSAASAAAVASR
jgi:hypothetical protein